MKGMDPSCHHMEQKPQQGLLVGEGNDSLHCNVYSDVHHLVIYFHHDKNQLYILELSFVLWLQVVIVIS